MLKNESGHFTHISPYTGVDSYLFYQTALQTGWKIAVVYSSTDLLGDPKVVEQKNINLSLSISLLILLVLLVYVDIESTPSMWRLAMMISLLFVVNIFVIWYIQLDVDYSEELSNRTRVYSKDALSTFIHKKNTEMERLGVAPYQIIPTGIHVNELLVTDSYDMGVSGKIWQKWPKNHDLPLSIGFQFDQAFPGGRSIITQLESKELVGDVWLYRWSFSAKLRIFFDYSNYPLDQHYIDIRLSYPDPTEDIMLVPDFDSYEVLNPSARPGLNNLLFLPRFRVIASYFSFLTTQVKTFYGKGSKLRTPEFESLEYNVVVKRRFITPFVTFVIPFVLGAGMIFFLLYSLSNDKNDNSGVTVMGAVQGMAALFFGMLLTHITIRNRIPTPVITYLESFYFLIYDLIIMLILIVVVFKKYPDHRLFGYRDNLITKIVYWPLLFGLLYFITWMKFY